MSVLGEVKRFQHKYLFLVEIGDFDRAEFKSCSELSAEIAKIEHWEGGSLIPYKEPGRITFTDVTLEAGVTISRELYDWFKEVADAVADSGYIVPEFKKDVDIVQLDRDRSRIRIWTLLNAWPTKFVTGEWNNEEDGVVIESVTLTYDIFRRPEDA